MPCCSAINCSNRTEKGYRLYRFPRNDKNRAKWVHNMRRGGNWQPSEAARLCEKHFEKTQFENKRADGKVKLRPNAVPTIFNLPNPPLNTECLKRRHYKAQELRAYLKSLGAEISEERSPKGIEDDLHKIIGVCDTCFKEGNEAEVEMVLNDIVSIMVLVPTERAENIILAFCEKLTKGQGQKLGQVCLKALWLLYQSLDERSPMRYPVYYHLLQIAKQTDQIKAIFQNVDHLKQQFSHCPLSNEELQKLYRLLHEVLLKSNQSEQAAKVMIELLGTYTDKTASHAREDAIRCITTAIADPNTFLLDPLLSLKPVHILKGQLIHDLLNIFVSENLTAYLTFYKEHKEFVTNQGLDHDQNMRKMRLLSFMQLAESNPEISFDVIAHELQIKKEEVEPFIIEVLKTKLVSARMDQLAKKVFVSSTMHRTFGRAQWQQLRDLLFSWKTNLSVVQEGMKTVTAAQIEILQQQS